MTIIKYKDNDELFTICASGHSGYDLLGKDIVCAAISVLMTTFINLHAEHLSKMDVDTDEGFMGVTIYKDYKNFTEHTKEYLIYGLKMIAEMYPQYAILEEIKNI